MSFVELLRRRAVALPKRIAFVEAYDDRVRWAAEQFSSAGVARAVVVEDARRPIAAGLAAGVEVVDPAYDARRGEVAALLAGLGAPRGEANPGPNAESPLYFAAALLKLGYVDGVVAGAVHTTAEVLRAALRVVGVAPGVSSVSGAFYMVTPGFRGEEEVLTFADCAVIREPTAQQLAEIALGAARDRRRIVGDEPVVALLSYSTRGSASGPTVDLVGEALQLIRQLDSRLIVDGELQGDAALARDVCERKAPASPVAGAANVLVFPTLDAGNIAYKLVQRIARAGAIGPILQGVDRPFNDLSRGSTRDDILNVAAVTALQGSGAGSD